MKKKTLYQVTNARIFFGVLACAALCVDSFDNTAHAATAVAAAPAPMLVRQGNRLSVPAGSPLRDRLLVATVGQQTSPHEVSLPATVEANPANTVNILPPLTGKLLELKVRLGDTVKRGQVLATMSSPDLAQAVSDAQKARDALDLAQRALVRARGVNEAGSNAAKDVEAAQSSVAQQGAELRRSEARLRSLGADGTVGNGSNGGSNAPSGQVLKIVAPMAGTVTALNAAAGANLNDANAALMTVSNLDAVWVTVNVPESVVGSVAPGQNAVVTLAAYPGRSFSGKVGFVSAVLDADTRRARARIVFANPEGLFKPNMYATAVLGVPQAAQAQVPASALLMNNDSVSVFVEAEPWTFVRRMVELGREDGDSVRIRSGLAAGERVVVRGGVLLND
ncbi:efflux RND transporter periplasmic adaptor subunit [Variovorax sp. J22G73]|jgi:cobalt-zinc-cadmium efflux system membrane fusion protein|uniref:efflux RND transporter periplasmic adaptor subunit n=1 Tax=unclassified Variovorax TaxID=663243 RepID=UPI000D5CB024|nr:MULTISPECIES: efflux RND transporter periplasmic adaptor subunit [unclassified Variovorax]MDM0006709.1 efflux RND transporter periplasmic adaptor subunit [Variovorax sp. J22R203]MDM0097267.1 efflux RND transporter periplasmic adaptor subunit [Variovorax sp. J22G73]